MHQNIIDKRYVLVQSLGIGGMGEVYLAHDEVLDRDVALKVLGERYAGDEGSAERFRSEALNAASLSHPNIIQIYNRGEAEDGTSYIVMEYVPGGTLSEQIEESGPFEAGKAAAVAAQIAEALGAAHERGVIHRDMKPQNVLMGSSGDLKVTDFGIARATVTSGASSAVFGTAGYISPEQAMGEPVGPASDLYSLGVVLYEMLTGELPYTADNSIAVCMKHVTEPLRPPKELNPAIPEEMNALVVKLLAKDPAERYGSAGELLADLEPQREDLPPVFGAAGATTLALGKGPQTAPRRGEEARRRRTSRTLAVAAVAMSVLLLGTVLPGLLQRGAARESLPRTQEVAHGFIDPPAKATATAADPTPDAPPATLSAASAPPAVPATPPPDYQTPPQSQYGVGGD
jgi:eukaryotic-like serine/threonine-protein kinase